MRPLRRQMQMVFQDPYSSLDPSAVVADIVGEPLRVHEGLKGKARDERVRELLRLVGLSPRYTERYPYEFSGGQRQRLAIARAIALNPSLIVLDEAVSALDVSTQNQILELLERLRDELGVAYLFISHNLSVIRWLADRTAVMYLGRIVEEGPTERVYSEPAHPYTESLLSAVPVPDPLVQRHRRRIILSGDIPDPLHPPSGCRFRTRCPHAMEICAEVDPVHTELPGGGWVACHLHTTHPGRRTNPTTQAPVDPPVPSV
jgi:oligopeptide/dipeptide ABC transporter ATP-binding protein